MKRPAVFLTAEWRHLTMLNFEIDRVLLARYVPAGTQLDSWRGKTFVSVVGFCFFRTRVLGVPIPHHRNFDEVNLRFYVKRDVDGGVRRGVVFIKEIVPRRAIAAVARRVYNENYIALPMRHRIDLAQTIGRVGEVSYDWRLQARWNSLSAEVEGLPTVPPDETEESFIAEHYWGYAKQPDGSALEYEVEHPPWRVWRARSAAFDCDVAGLYGAEFEPFLGSVPGSAFVAEGSPIKVHWGRSLGS
jgi:uncharacterized protein YqjF (DUF2071 family)